MRLSGVLKLFSCGSVSSASDLKAGDCKFKEVNSSLDKVHASEGCKAGASTDTVHISVKKASTFPAPTATARPGTLHSCKAWQSVPARTPAAAQQQKVQRSDVFYESAAISARVPGHNWSLQDFLPEKLLHKGYAATVFKAWCLKTREHVIIKRYKLDLDELTKYQVMRESALHASVSHPNIVNLNLVFKDGDFWVLVIEYAAGGDLRSFTNKDKGRLSESAVAAKVLLPVLQALQYLHSRGIVHRDIKPGNLLFTNDGVLKICDFGVAINLEEEEAVTCAGTTAYMAPEVQRCPP